MVLHTPRVTISWRFHCAVSQYKLETDQIPQVPLLGKGMSGYFTALWCCTGFLPTLFCTVSLSVIVFGQDYDPKGHQSVFHCPVKKELYLLWMIGIPHGNREYTHEGLIQWALTYQQLPSYTGVPVHSSPLVRLVSHRAFGWGKLSNFSFTILPHDPW